MQPSARAFRPILRGGSGGCTGATHGSVVGRSSERTEASPPSGTGIARRARVWALHPVLYDQGREAHRIIAPSQATLDRIITLLGRLGEGDSSR